MTLEEPTGNEKLTSGDESEGAQLERIRNTAMAGMCVVAVSGEQIQFDAQGIATVKREDASYLATIAGYERVAQE
jgi:hypothetical protein